LEGYIFLHRRLIPRLIIYSMFFLGLAIGEAYVFFTTRRLSPEVAVSLITSIAAFAIMFVEGLIMRFRLKPG